MQRYPRPKTDVCVVYKTEGREAARRAIFRALVEEGGNGNAAAARLGIPISTFFRQLRELGCTEERRRISRSRKSRFRLPAA